MVTVPPNRRLAAVLFADVAAYSRLMEQDEAGTHVRVGRVFADVLESSIAKEGGRLIKRTGDGILAEFPSATAAPSHGPAELSSWASDVRCADATQRSERTSELSHSAKSSRSELPRNLPVSRH